MGTLRVIGGSAKGLRLKTVPGETTRPITDLVKEALFNILGDEVRGIRMLDLFGGTGAVGIEALSRGANYVLFLDKSAQAVATINENLKITHFSAQAKVLKTDAFNFLNGTPSAAFDLIYVAPPQYKDLWLKAMGLIEKYPGWLGSEAQIIVQINPIEWTDIPFEGLEVFDQRKYGDTLLVFYQKISPKIA